MKYKALMLDVDGTLVPYDYDALPSEKVREAVKKAQEKVTVCVVTGREYSFIRDILDVLDIHAGYAVVNNGGNVVEIATETLLYDQPIGKKESEEIAHILFEEKIPFYVKQSYDDHAILSRGPHKKEHPLEKAYMFFVMEQYPEERIDAILKKLSEFSNLTLTKANHALPKSFGLGINHIKATKMHGVEVIMKELGLQREELIGVGDSYNDFPLLMSCGLKVAMGNAIPDLKAIADYVAPSVTEDGVAAVIEKFILSSD